MYLLKKSFSMMVMVSILVICLFTMVEAETTLTVWDQFFPSAQNELMKAFVEEFEANHPGVNVERSVLDTDSIRVVLKTALASKEGPDVFYYDAGPSFLGALIDPGLVYDLTEEYTKRGWDKRIANWAQLRVMNSGKIYGVPNEVEYTCVYYNKEIMEEIGMADKIISYPENPAVKTLSSFDDYIKILEAAKNAGYVPIAFANRDPGRGGHVFSYLVELTTGRDQIEEILFGDGVWNSQRVVESLQIFKDMNDNGYFPRNVNALGYDEGNSLFFMGQAATHITGTWLIADIMEQMPNPDVVDFFLLPTVAEENPMRAAAGIGSTWAVSSNSDNKELALEFLDYIMSVENARRWLEEGSIIPPINGIQPEKYELTHLMSAAVAGFLIPQGHGFNLDSVMPALWNDAMKNGTQAIINNQKSPQEVANDMQNAWITSKGNNDIWNAK